MSKKEISIIIVTYNSQSYMDDCLNSIGEFLDLPASEVEVIITDNSFGKDAAEMKSIAETHQLHQKVEIKYIHNEANLGYGQGNNVGIKASSGKIICIMNPDVRFGSSVLKDVLEKFKNPKLALLSYKQIGGLDRSFYLRPELKIPISNILEKLANKIDIFNPKYEYLSGAFFFVDKAKFEEVGLFDEKIFMYYEEPDIAIRLLAKNYQIKYDNSKKYFHLVGDRTGWSEKAFLSETNSLKYYIQKFNFNQQKIVKAFLAEYKIKIFAAKLLKDKTREEKFVNEAKKFKEIFSK